MARSFRTLKRYRSTSIILILGAMVTLSPFSIDLYLPALGRIAHEFATNASTASLSVSSYFMGLALAQILYGPFLDRYGRKGPVYVGTAVYILASLGCMSSHTVHALVAWRLLQGIGGCVTEIAAMAMVRDYFPLRQSARIFSLLVLVLGMSPLLAPSVGGFLSVWIGWRWIFGLLIVLAILIVGMMHRYLPTGYQPDAQQRINVKRMLNTYFSIAKNRLFLIYTLASACSFTALFVYVAASPMMYMQTYGMTAQQYGLSFAVLAAAFIGGNQINIVLLRSIHSERIFSVSLIAQGVLALMFWVLCLWQGDPGLWITFGFQFAILLCLGLINPNGSALAMGVFDQDIGSAAALLGFLQLGISSLASALIGLIHIRTIQGLGWLIVMGSVLALIPLAAGRKWYARAPHVS